MSLSMSLGTEGTSWGCLNMIWADMRGVRCGRVEWTYVTHVFKVAIPPARPWIVKASALVIGPMAWTTVSHTCFACLDGSNRLVDVGHGERERWDWVASL